MNKQITTSPLIPYADDIAPLSGFGSQNPPPPPPPGTVATPTITPDGGTFTSPQPVALADATSGASIFYTLDGTPPTAASLPYTGPFTLSANATVNAIGIATGMTDSNVASAVFTFTLPPPNPPPHTLTSITVTPANPNVTGGNTVPFTATGNYSDGSPQALKAVAWSISGTATGSNIDALSGLFSAGYIVGADVVTATDPDTGISGNTTVAVIPGLCPGKPPTSISISPSNATVSIGVPYPFTAQDQLGQSIPAAFLGWSLATGGGSISPTGAYTATANAVGIPVTIKATTCNGLSATATAIILAPGASLDISNATPGPVPWKANTSPASGITFYHLAPGSTIRLFTSNGLLARTLTSPDGSPTPWDLQNSGGDNVASGVYYYIIDAAGMTKKGKVVVIK